jgi:hypothetical protein
MNGCGPARKSSRKIGGGENENTKSNSTRNTDAIPAVLELERLSWQGNAQILALYLPIERESAGLVKKRLRR